MLKWEWGNIKVYGQDERGRETYLGRIRAKRRAGGYFVRIPEKYAWMTVSGRFVLKSDWLFLFFHKNALLEICFREESRILPANFRLLVAIEEEIC